MSPEPSRPTLLQSAQRVTLVAVCVAALAACATTREPMTTTTDAEWDERRQTLQALEEWELRGRISLSTPSDALSGTLTWRQMFGDMDFRFRGPLGIGGMRISGDEQQLRVKTSNGDEFYLTDPVADLESRFGWHVPLYSMQHWVLGVPSTDGEEAAEQLDGSGRLASLQQHGWTVAYESYREAGEHQLPRKLVMENGEIRIRLVVDRWSFFDDSMALSGL
ncbi:MAG: lipoprotein insertase outer membrane protein LolB [Pseudomonadota bacterium]